MNIHNKLEREKRHNILKIVFTTIIASAAGYFLYLLISGSFFVGWEIYFAVICYCAILIGLCIADLGIFRWMYYSIYLKDSVVKIRDGFFDRVISIPADRIYYISSRRRGNLDYDSILITDKKINHKKIKRLSEEEFINEDERIEIIKELSEIYPGKTFYYYRVRHHGYKFFYYFYMLYRNCEKCKFSDTSMELVKGYIGQGQG